MDNCSCVGTYGLEFREVREVREVNTYGAYFCDLMSVACGFALSESDLSPELRLYVALDFLVETTNQRRRDRTFCTSVIPYSRRD